MPRQQQQQQRRLEWCECVTKTSQQHNRKHTWPERSPYCGYTNKRMGPDCEACACRAAFPRSPRAQVPTDAAAGDPGLMKRRTGSECAVTRYKCTHTHARRCNLRNVARGIICMQTELSTFIGGSTLKRSVSGCV